MPTCQAKLRDDKPCPKTVEEGKTLCRWHDPKDETWREDHRRLEKSTPEERVDIVLKLIEDHPEHRLVLQERGGMMPNLELIDLSQKMAILKRKEYGIENPPWWSEQISGITLRFASLQGAFLSGANLQGADLGAANLQDAFLGYANLQGADFGGAYLKDIVFSRANLQDAKFDRAILPGAILEESRLQGVDFSHVFDMSNVFISGAYLDKTRIRKEKLGKAIGEELKKDFSAAKKGYLGLKQNFDDFGDYDAASWAYRKERRMERLEAKRDGSIALYFKEPNKAIAGYSKFVGDTLVQALCDYGESVWRVIGWILFLTLIIGPLLFSWLGRQEWNGELLKSYNALPSAWQRFWFRYSQFLIYTFDSLTTANFSGIQPINAAFKLASGMFAFAGIFLAGLLGFVAGNRIRRS